VLLYAHVRLLIGIDGPEKGSRTHEKTVIGEGVRYLRVRGEIGAARAENRLSHVEQALRLLPRSKEIDDLQFRKCDMDFQASLVVRACISSNIDKHRYYLHQEGVMEKTRLAWLARITRITSLPGCFVISTNLG
jgi:hypothetical protein